jgi:tetratricopeptide (TPR) repeat protein
LEEVQAGFLDFRIPTTKLRAKSKTHLEDEEEKKNPITPSEISLDMRTDKVDGSKTMECIDKAMTILNQNVTQSVEGEISSCLDMYQLHLFKTQALIDFHKFKEAYDHFYCVFTSQSLKAISLYAFVLEAELVLKVENDYKKAKEIIESVLKTDELHFKALLQLAYIYIFYEGKYQKALDYLLRAKLLNPKSHELWNLLGHAYSFIDGVTDKAEE